MFGSAGCLLFNLHVTKAAYSQMEYHACVKYVGFSDDCSSLVPKYHVFDDVLENVDDTGVSEDVIHDVCNKLFKKNFDTYVDEKNHYSGDLTYYPQPFDEFFYLNFIFARRIFLARVDRVTLYVYYTEPPPCLLLTT